MENYDSPLTGAQIESALEAVNGLIAASNNGKVIVVENGALTAKSASEIEIGTIEALTVTENGTYNHSGAGGYNPVTVNVNLNLQNKTITENGTYQADDGYNGLGTVTVNVLGSGQYTNASIFSSEELIDDVSDFTLLYDTSKPYGSNGSKVATRLAITDESSHTTLQSQGWNASGMSYYDIENQIGAYGGYSFGEEINVTKAKFWLNRYSGQNTALTVTVEYLDEDGVWNEIEDLSITTTLTYPSYIFTVVVNRACYGIRWIHKKTPNKSGGNNITFAGMTVYKGSGTQTNVYIPSSTGLISPPSGYAGFGTLYIP